MALQIKTWCHLQQISAVGFNVSLSEVCWESDDFQQTPANFGELILYSSKDIGKKQRDRKETSHGVMTERQECIGKT